MTGIEGAIDLIGVITGSVGLWRRNLLVPNPTGLVAGKCEGQNADRDGEVAIIIQQKRNCDCVLE